MDLMKKGIVLLFLCLFLVGLCGLSSAQITEEKEREIVEGLDQLSNFEQLGLYVICYEGEECTEEYRSNLGFIFNNDPTVVEFEAILTNPFATDTEFYLVAKEDGEWKVVQIIDTVGSYSEKSTIISLEFVYAGQSTERNEVAIVGVSEGGKIKNEFVITEDWSPYEELELGLFIFGIPITIVLGIILMLLVGAITAFVFLRRRPVGEIKYTFKGLFIPSIKGRSFKELIALIILNPIFWLFELICGAIIICIIFIFSLMDVGFIGFMIFLIGGMFAISAPVAYLFIAWLIDWYEREPFRFLLSIFFWGIFAAFISFFANTIIGWIAEVLFGLTLGEFGLFLSMIFGAVIVAPVVEETAKGFGVLILAGHREMNDVLDGILYGFGVGMGFAFIENWLYFTSVHPAAVGGLIGWGFLIFSRSTLCALGHGWFTASTGAIIAFIKGKTGKFNYLYFIPAVVVAIILHGIFNFVAFIDGLVGFFVGIPVPIFDPIGMFILTAIFGVIVFFQLMKNKEEFFRMQKKGK